MTLEPTEAPEHIGMQVPGPREQEKLLEAQNHLRDAYRLLDAVRKAIAGERVKDSPAQVALKASVAAVKFAGVALSDTVKGSRLLKGGAS